MSNKDNPDILLDLSTSRQRERIAIDGKQYELSAAQDFELREYLWLAEKGKKIQELGPDSYDAAKFAKLSKTLDLLVCKIVRTKMPRRVLKKLTSAQKIAIMNAFTEAVGIKEATARPTPQDGTSLSPASNDSTEEQSQAGSRPASGL
tara:strand:- start:11197 stop:11640 length:444 start_codon:yes stop_codon:yes gene_type:complete